MFTLVYGRGPESLAEQLKVDVAEAIRLIGIYFESYSQVKRYLDETAAQAVRERSSRTMTGRIRYYETGNLPKFKIASMEREGKNTPIQGSSADMIKLAMHLVHNKLLPYGIEDLSLGTDRAVIVNNIHDEIVCECPSWMADEVCALVKAGMEEAGSMMIKSVPILSEAHVCDSWIEK